MDSLSTNIRISLNEDRIRKFRGDVNFNDDGSVIIKTIASECDGIEDKIAVLEKMAQKAHLTLNVDRTVEGKFFIYKLSTFTGRLSIDGYTYIGMVVPVSSEDGTESFDALIFPSEEFDGNKQILDILKKSQANQRCDACGKKRTRGTYFAFIKQEDNSLFIVGKDCAKRYMNIELSSTVLKFINELCTIKEFATEWTGDEDWDDGPETVDSFIARQKKYDGKSYKINVENIGRTMYGYAVENGYTSPKSIQNFQHVSEAMVDSEVFYDEYIKKIGNYVDKEELGVLNLVNHWKEIFAQTYGKGEEFFKGMYEWYNSQNESALNDFMLKMKQMAFYSEKNAFAGRSVISTTMAAWVTCAYLKANPNLIKHVEQQEPTGEYPVDGTKITGTFTVNKITQPKPDEFKSYAENVTQAGLWIIDNSTNLPYYISLTSQKQFNYGFYQHHTAKFDHNFSIGEQLELSGKVKTISNSDKRMLTYVKFTSQLATKEEQTGLKNTEKESMTEAIFDTGKVITCNDSDGMFYAWKSNSDGRVHREFEKYEYYKNFCPDIFFFKRDANSDIEIFDTKSEKIIFKSSPETVIALVTHYGLITIQNQKFTCYPYTSDSRNIDFTKGYEPNLDEICQYFSNGSTYVIVNKQFNESVHIMKHLIEAIQSFKKYIF